MFAGRSAVHALPSPFAVVLSLVIGISALALPVRADDTWWHLRAGAEILARGSLLTTNTFSFTAPDAPWLMHEWLSEVLLAGTLQFAGTWGLVLLGVCLLALTVTVAWRLLARREDTGWAAALVALFVAVLLLPAFSLRPWIFSNACFAGVLLLAHAHVRRGWKLAGMVALFSLWANLHGSFPAGLLALGVLLLLGPREVVPLLGAAVAGTLLTPSPLERFLHPLQYAAGSLGGQPGYLREVMRQNLEWQPPGLGTPLGALLMALVALCVAVVLASGERPRWGHVALAGIFTAMAFSSMRNIPLAGLSACPLLGQHLPGAVRRWRASRPLSGLPSSHVPLPLAVLAACGWVLGSALPALADPAQLSPSYFPAGLLQQLERHRPARPFNHYDYGGAVQWALWPRVRPFWDQRVDCYPPEVIRDGLALHNVAPGWEEILQRWKIDAVAYRADTALAQALRADERWQVAWEDGDSVLFLPAGR